jgi:hypothetical protein
MSYLLGLVDASGSSAALAYAQLMVPGQPSAMVQPAKTFPPLPPPVPLPAVPLPAVPLPLPALPPDDEPADGDVPPDDEPADDGMPPDDEPADGDAPPNDEPADDDVPPDDEPADDDEPDVEIEDEPAEVEAEEAPPDELLPELSLVVPQATTTGVTASAEAQASNEIRMRVNPGVGRRRRAVRG